MQQMTLLSRDSLHAAMVLQGLPVDTNNIYIYIYIYIQHTRMGSPPNPGPTKRASSVSPLLLRGVAARAMWYNAASTKKGESTTIALTLRFTLQFLFAPNAPPPRHRDS